LMPPFRQTTVIWSLSLGDAEPIKPN